MADETLTRIILQNPFVNAVQYSHDGDTISVSLSANATHVTYAVSDTGIGIPSHQQGRIFDKLFRADNAVKTVVEGTGLGLYIVKAILDHVGGTIAFTSTEGQGSTFTITLPRTGMQTKAGTRKLEIDHKSASSNDQETPQ